MYLADIYKGREVFSEVRDLCSMMMRHSDNKEVCSAQRARGNLKGGLTYIAFGEGPPLVVFPVLARRMPIQLECCFASRWAGSHR